MRTSTNKWQLIHLSLDTYNDDIHLTLLNRNMPQIPLIEFLKPTIPCVGGVSWRQALFSRAKLKETKGQSIAISKFHRNLDNMTINDNTVLSFQIVDKVVLQKGYRFSFCISKRKITLFIKL